MPEVKSYKEMSRIDWGRAVEAPNTDQIKLGCIMRIADATELMAKSNADLVWQRDHFKRRAHNAEASLSTMTRSRNALKGVITRMKKAKK